MKLVQKYKNLSRKKKLLFWLVLIIAVGLLSAYAFGLFDKKEEPTPEPIKYHSQLTGEEVSEEESNQPILGIMIENSEEARPQSGLDSAGIVYETVTEGGITRYLALFQEELPKDVGPVRSVRPPFVSWITGMDGSVAHVGGSAEALALVETLNTKSLTQFTYFEPYRRVANRIAPHNVYADPQKLRDLQEKLEHKKSNISEIPRSDDAPSQTPQATKIIIDFSSSPVFEVQFRYNKENNSYTRYLAGQPHIDELTKKPITVKNVVVLELKGTDSNSLRPVGSGVAYVFKDGNVQKVRWEKPSHNDRLKLVDDTGNEVSLNRGDTWIAGLPSGKKVEY